MNVKLKIIVLVSAFSLPAYLQADEYRHAVHEAVDGTTLSLENLVGTITLEPGDAFVIRGDIVARGRDAEALARGVTLERDGHVLWLEYPESNIRYGMRGGSTTVNYRGQRISVRGRGRGAEVHAELTVTVPAGATVSVENLVGSLVSNGIDANATLRTASGSIDSSNGRGPLEMRAGSGQLSVAGHEGAAGLRTGSGRIDVTRIHGDSLRMRSGSGSIRVTDASGDLNARTGSGGMRILEFTAGAVVEATSGSGSIRIEGDLGAVRDLDISAGSGGVDIRSTAMPDMTLRASAGSGRVRVDAPGATLTDERRNRVEAVLGDGSGTGRISTGSGSISVRVGD